MNSFGFVACYVFTIILLAVNTCTARPHDHNSNNGAISQQQQHVEISNQNNDDFDYLVFRQIWPEASCMYPGSHSCSIAKNISTWVVHGLWPSIRSHMGPQFCQKIPFNFNNIKWLLPQLLEFWPNLYTDTPLDSFWEHEWTKHGTCAVGKVKDINTESDYFNVTLGLRNHFDFGLILKASNIVPDDKKLYDLSDIKEAIKSVLNVEPSVDCYVLQDSNVQYISQMQICLSKTFDLVDCGGSQSAKSARVVRDTSSPQETQCLNDLPVHYPVIKPTNNKSN